MIVLNQQSVIKAHPVVHGAAHTGGIFGQFPVSGDGFTGIQQAAVRMFDLAHIGTGEGRNA